MDISGLNYYCINLVFTYTVCSNYMLNNFKFSNYYIFKLTYLSISGITKSRDPLIATKSAIL